MLQSSIFIQKLRYKQIVTEWFINFKRIWCSDVNKDLGLKAKAKAKDSDPKVKSKDLSHKAKAKDLCHKAKAKAKDLGLKAKVKDPKYQGQIFHRSSPYSVHPFFIVNVVCVSMFGYYFTC